jgi:hypothetical protein
MSGLGEQTEQRGRGATRFAVPLLAETAIDRAERA